MPRSQQKGRRTRRQRGGGDDCGPEGIGKVRLPGGQCFDWYDTAGHEIMKSVDPIYHDQLKKRVLLALLEWRKSRINAGDNPGIIDDDTIEYINAATWPRYISGYIINYLGKGADDRKGLYDGIRHLRGTRPPYAAVDSPPSPPAAPPLTQEQLYALYIMLMAQAQQAPPPDPPVGLPPFLGPLTSESPIYHKLEYSDTHEANQIPPPEANTRKKIIVWIKQAPFAGNQDPVIRKKWHKMNLEELRNTVRTEEGRVYRTDTLEGIIQAAVDEKIVPRDPLSRKRFTRKNFRALRDVKLRSDPAYQLPMRIQQRPPRYMEFVVTNSDDGFFHLALVDGRMAPKETIQDLGYIPGTLDSVHTGSADYSSGVLLALLQDAWTNGKFLDTYTKPFTCCRFHLRKDKAWWTSPGSTPVDRLKAMIDEVRANTT
jgi:hypothetical protein